jgi:hypothetical protein
MKIRFYPILCVFISPLVLSAQDELNTSNNQSYVSWNALQLQYEPIEKLSLSLEAQLRLKSTGDTYKMSFFEAQAEYELKPFLEVGVGYRNSDQLDDVGKKQGHEKFNRFFGFAQAKTSFNRFDFRFRVLHQVKTQRNVLVDPKENSRWRYKISSRYNIPNWELDPRFSIEFFMLEEFYSAEAYDKFRLSIGSKKRFSNTSALSFKYLFEKEVGIIEPVSYHILSLRYEFLFQEKAE